MIGKLAVKNTVFLAPMSGVTDEAFRLAAHQTGAGLVVSEMVASEELVRERRDARERIAERRAHSRAGTISGNRYDAPPPPWPPRS